MGDLLIRNVPEPLKDQIREAAKQDGESLSDEAIDLLRRGLVSKRQNASIPKRSAWEVLRTAFEEAGAVDEEFWKVMQEVEAERKRDFGRPVDFESSDDEAK